jgi:UDP-N-acetylmuramoyl-L-alanyl-D-glutamate--2,6-diaminopimelate ligase
MKLAQLFSIYGQLKWGLTAEREVAKICRNSSEVIEDSVFVAVRGTTIDGHKFVPVACEQGAIGLVVEDVECIPAGYTGAVVKVKNSRAALDVLAARYNDNPADELFCVGVTGTNGKTTVTYMVEQVLKEFGWLTGVMGTINHHLGDRVWPSSLTTPDAIVFHSRLKDFIQAGASAVVLEVSSHALEQRRVQSVPFDVAVFTNLTRDHMDYHQNMENYFAAKEILFTEILAASKKRLKFAIVNVDDPWGRKLSSFEGAQLWTYGMSDCDLQFQVLERDFSGSRVELKTPHGVAQWRLPMAGLHNVYNAVAAVGVGLAAGASLDVCRRALESLAGVPGRLESVSNNHGVHVLVDYAHTDDALRNVLSSLQEVKEGLQRPSKIICVFGCGGDRDRGKRPLMGKVATAAADYVFITSDNPRNENPEDIISDICRGFSAELLGHSVFVEADRELAIQKALRLAQCGDVVLIAGKGHEDYQIVGDKKLPFSDRLKVEEYFNGMGTKSRANY